MDNSNIPSCAIVDIRMNGMSGLELQDMLIERGIRMSLIFLSGHGTVENVVNSLKSGAVTFLSKPTSLDKIREAIESEISYALEISDHKKAFRRQNQ